MPLVRPRACDLSPDPDLQPFLPLHLFQEVEPFRRNAELRRRDLHTAHSGSSLRGRVGWSERGCQNTLIIGSTRYPVKPRCGQLTNEPWGESSTDGFQNMDIEIHNLQFLEGQSPKGAARNPETEGNPGGPALAGELLLHLRGTGQNDPPQDSPPVR